MKDINGSLDTNLKVLDSEEKQLLKRDMAKNGGKPNKNRQEIQYYFLKVL